MADDTNDPAPLAPSDKSAKKQTPKARAAGVPKASQQEIAAAREDIRFLYKVAILTMLSLTAASVLTALALTVHAQVMHVTQTTFPPSLIPTGTSGLFSASTLVLLQKLYAKFYS